ncbi:uncharacterized protein LOC123381008 isoform X1 [Felis catus]|uniref:uncharacterized protein LOC123381008 isoform X1 n=1 Tax=Felis catus TaxID=9685 RepID=UPI001D1A2BFC|nr:uncharacterized protein LOC123381008 isoform X1 [Felis catus]
MGAGKSLVVAGPGEMKADSGTWHIQNLYLWDSVWGTCIHHFRNPCPSTEQSPGLKLPVPKRVILLIKRGFDREEGEETRKPRRAVMFAGLKHTEDSSHPGTKVSDTMDGLVSWIAKEWLYQFAFPPIVQEGSPLSTSMPTSVISCVVDFSHSDRFSCIFSHHPEAIFYTEARVISLKKIMFLGCHLCFSAFRTCINSVRFHNCSITTSLMIH